MSFKPILIINHSYKRTNLLKESMFAAKYVKSHNNKIIIRIKKLNNQTFTNKPIIMYSDSSVKAKEPEWKDKRENVAPAMNHLDCFKMCLSSDQILL